MTREPVAVSLRMQWLRKVLGIKESPSHVRATGKVQRGEVEDGGGEDGGLPHAVCDGSRGDEPRSAA